MADRLTERRARHALADLEAGRLQDVAAFLAKLGDMPVPELPETPTSTLKRRVRRLETELKEARERAARLMEPAPPGTLRAREQLAEDYAAVTYERPIRPQPKPSKRVVARDVVAEFRATHQRCAVLGCPNGDADPHHIWPKGRQGPDETFNLMPLCSGPFGHHEEIERIDAEAFAARYASRLPHVYLLRIKHALAAEALKKLADRPAIDLDAELDAELG